MALSEAQTKARVESNPFIEIACTKTTLGDGAMSHMTHGQQHQYTNCVQLSYVYHQHKLGIELQMLHFQYRSGGIYHRDRVGRIIRLCGIK